MVLQWNDKALKQYGFNDEEIARLKTEAEKMGPDSIQYFREQGWLQPEPQPQVQQPTAVSVPRNGSPQDVKPVQQETQMQGQPQPQPTQEDYDNQARYEQFMAYKQANPQEFEGDTWVGDKQGSIPPVQSNTDSETQPMSSGDRIFTEEDYNALTQMSPEMADTYRGWIGQKYSDIDSASQRAAGVATGLPAAAVSGGLLSGLIPAGVSNAVSPYVNRAGYAVRELQSGIQQLSNGVAGALPPAPPGGIMNTPGGWRFLP